MPAQYGDDRYRLTRRNTARLNGPLFAWTCEVAHNSKQVLPRRAKPLGIVRDAHYPRHQSSARVVERL